MHTADGATTWFTTVANTGFDAVANAWANTVTWTSGTPLYVLATLRTLAAYSPTPVRVTVDDATTIETEAWLVAVGNTRTYASGMMITPAASVHDGLLDVCVVGPVSRIDFLRTFPSVFSGTHVEHPEVRTARPPRRRRSDRARTRGRPVGQRRARGRVARAARTGRRRALGRRAEHGVYLTVSVPSMPCARCPVMLQ